MHIEHCKLLCYRDPNSKTNNDTQLKKSLSKQLLNRGSAPLPEFLLTQNMVSMHTIKNSSRNKILDLTSPIKGKRAIDDKVNVSNHKKLNQIAT